MKFFPFYLIFCLPFYSTGQQTINGSITHDGLKREYILYVPDSYTPGTPAPLVFNFHGYTSNALEQMFYGDFRPIADTAGFLVVHPQGTKDLLGNNHWNVGWGSSTVDDVGFTGALIDSLSAQYDIDQDRIYSTGMSNGGFMSYKLACELSDRIAAIASVTGTMNANQSAICDPHHPMPIMEIHGTADPTVSYNGTTFFEDIPSVLAYWAGYNSCDLPPFIYEIPDNDPNDGCTAEHHIWLNGTNEVQVEHFKIIDGAHAWPGSAFGGAGTNQDIDASKEIWRFFSYYDIHSLSNTTATDHSANRQSVLVYPNPAITSISIKIESGQPARFTLSTVFGQVIITGTAYPPVQEVQIGALSPGLYVLNVGKEKIKIVKTAGL